MPNLLISKMSFHEINVLFKLTLPLILTGLVEASIGFFSTLFLAHLGEQELAAGAIVSWVFVTLMVILWGTLCSVSLLIAQKHGAKDPRGLSRVLRDGLSLALIFVIPAMVILWFMSPVLLLIGEDPSTVVLANEYIHGLVWGVLPDFLTLVLMQFLIGLGHTRTNMFFTFLWVPLNILCNYVLIFGKFGFPALGMVGIGWGTTIAYWITCIALVIYLLTNEKYKSYFKNITKLGTPNYIYELWQIGLPMGAMYCIEIGYFLVLTLFMGHIGSKVLAANQIVLQYGWLAFVIMFAIAQAVTVRMGHALGAKDPATAERCAYLGLALSLFFTIIIAFAFWFFPYQLVGIDLNLSDPDNKDTIMYAKEFLAISAIYQIAEAIRITFFGALRGLKDTRFTLLVSILSFWGIALPVGYILAVMLHMQGSGYWWGLLIGTSVGMIMLYYRFRYKMQRKYQKLHAAATELKNNF